MTYGDILREMLPCSYEQGVCGIVNRGVPLRAASGVVREASEIHDGWLSPGRREPRVTVKDHLCGKYLILLPCNSQASAGNYFLGSSWEFASRFFPERRSSVDFAATDSISIHLTDDKGLFVFENEMHRVQGYDAYPAIARGKVDACIALAKLGRERLLSYEKVFIYLNVSLYRKAVDAIELPNSVAINIPLTHGGFRGNLRYLRHVFEQHVNKNDLMYSGCTPTPVLMSNKGWDR